jgi:hypothetical protein
MTEMELTTLSCSEMSHSFRSHSLVRKERNSSSSFRDSLVVKGGFK